MQLLSCKQIGKEVTFWNRKTENGAKKQMIEIVRDRKLKK